MKVNSKILIYNARVITPMGVIERGWVLVDEGRIALIGRENWPDFPDALNIDAGGKTALPGFIDVHVHGSDGYECMDGKAESLRGMARFFARHGVTAFTPSTWTASGEEIHATLATIAAHQGPQPEGATIIGGHLEGPYLNPARCGAQDPNQIRRAGREEALAFLDYGTLRLVALAPEYEENLWLIEECVRRGITVSAAHSAATYEEMKRAVDLGLTQATHTYNAMTGLHHRQPGTLGAAMALDEISCELIGDNIHVHPVSQNILLRVKGVERIILITDAVRGAGMADGQVYTQDGRQVTAKGGAMYLPDGTLAGSGLTLNKGLYNLMQASGKPLEALWQTSSLNAARNLNLGQRKGSLEVGKDADVILVDEAINVYLTIAEGRIVYQKEA